MAKTSKHTSILGTIASAFRAAGSMSEGAMPTRADLIALGIDATEFRRTTRR